MKNKIIGTLVLGCVVIASANAASATMMTSTQVQMSSSTMVMNNGSVGASAANMSIIPSNPGAAPKVLVNLGAPASLVVYDQNNNVALSTQLPAGQTTIDTSNFPLGNDMLVVTTNQNGSTFTMKQAVTVESMQANS